MTAILHFLLFSKLLLLQRISDLIGRSNIIGQRKRESVLAACFLALQNI